MKSFCKALRLSFIFAAFAAAACVRADIEFIGLLVDSRSSHFALGETATGKTTWVGTGEVFAGWKVVSYDPKGDTLLLAKAGADLRVRLKDDAKIKAARLELTGEISFGSGAPLTISRATLLLGQENVLPLGKDMIYRITPTRLADGNLGFAIIIESREADGTMKQVAATRVMTLPGRHFSIKVGDYEFSFNPKPP